MSKHQLPAHQVSFPSRIPDGPNNVPKAQLGTNLFHIATPTSQLLLSGIPPTNF